ncbi:MAG TPA: hypothetical protein VMW35_13850 [Myxococcota bacterium]|nr:hypothetical protein [Myxococcota bacterium]
MRRAARRAAVALALGVAAGGAPATAAEGPNAARSFDALYDVRLVAGEGIARVAIELGPVAGRLHWIQLRIDPQRQFGFQGDGTIEAKGDIVRWVMPPAGGRLEYTVRIDHLRDERSYDARCAKSWALFRGEDLVPRSRLGFERGATSSARLRVRLPEGWSVATPYAKGTDGTYILPPGTRVLAKPAGWLVAGHLGVLREKIAGVSVAIASPRGQRLHRLDLLAFLRWTMPDLLAVVGRLPERLLVVGAGDPMWRGGLSGPSSLYLHADRPLIAGDTTSPVLHELMHVAMRAVSGRDGDWIAEGLAEYYSIELLARSRAIGRKRFEKAMAKIEERGKAARRLLVPQSTGAVTARAVGVMRALDAEIRRASGGTRSLDDVVQALAADPVPITTARFAKLVSIAAGSDLEPLVRRLVGEDWMHR